MTKRKEALKGATNFQRNHLETAPLGRGVVKRQLSLARGPPAPFSLQIANLHHSDARFVPRPAHIAV